MFLTRSVTCILVNQTSLPLVHNGNYKLAHGSLDTAIPERIAPGGSGQFKSSTAGFMTGTEGWAMFELDGGKAMFEVDWDNPFIGANEFKQAFRLLSGVDECPAGTYVESKPVAINPETREPLTEQDMKDADDIVVVYTLKIEPKPAVAEGDAAGSPAEAAAPAPDPNAPQVVDVAPGQENHASETAVNTPPRLVVALNEVDPDDGGGDNTDIEPILELIAKRLEGGLDVVWQKGEKKRLWDPKKWKASDPEERWARAITEVLLGLTYNGSAAVYGHPNQDNIFYDPFSDPAKSPIAPMAAACQHLVSFGIMSRGFRLAQVGNTGFSCNQASSFDVFRKGGKWSAHEPTQTNIATAIDWGLGPGGVYVFNPDEAAGRAYEGAHIAFILRVDKDQKQAQFFDTGGLQVPERVSGPVPHVMVDFKSKGSYDEPLWDKVTTPKYIGMGTPAAAADLTTATARLKTVRHTGLCRLVLTRRGASFKPGPEPGKIHPDLLFVSRMLRMYGDLEDQNYCPSRYYWSLRALPGTKQIQAYWFFYVPIDGGGDTPEARAKVAKATAMMKGPRTQKVDDLGTMFKQRLLILGSEADGKAKQFSRCYTEAAHNEPGSTKKAQSRQVEEPENAVPSGLLSFVDKLPLNETYPGKDAFKLPGLFLDYAGSGTVTA